MLKARFTNLDISEFTVSPYTETIEHLMDENRSKVSERILVSLIPVLGCINAFAYEYGYSKAFNYPISLISINIDTILLASTSTFLFLNLIFFCL